MCARDINKIRPTFVADPLDSMNADPASVGLIQSIVDDSMDSGSESPSPQEIKGEPVECKVYPGRFYVLMVLSFVAIQQNVAWLTFGTIPDESYEHFRLSNVEIAILAGKFVHSK